jgi:hypothetical protein
LLIAEDVDGRWLKYLGFSLATEKPNWRLLTPGGMVAWTSDGIVTSSELTEALDTNLITSIPAQADRIQPGFGVGERLAVILAAGRDCPPIPLQRADAGGARVAFVDRRAASAETLSALQRDSERPCVAVVVDGASIAQVRRLQKELAIDIPLLPDPGGALTRSAGVFFTPSVITLDATGRLVQIDRHLRARGTAQ